MGSQDPSGFFNQVFSVAEVVVGDQVVDRLTFFLCCPTTRGG